jgi:hypothetical protein
VVISVIKIAKILDDKIKIPEDWQQAVRILHRKDQKILTLIQQFPESMDLLAKERSMILKLKVQ